MRKLLSFGRARTLQTSGPQGPRLFLEGPKIESLWPPGAKIILEGPKIENLRPQRAKIILEGPKIENLWPLACSSNVPAVSTPKLSCSFHTQTLISFHTLQGDTNRERSGFNRNYQGLVGIDSAN